MSNVTTTSIAYTPICEAALKNCPIWCGFVNHADDLVWLAGLAGTPTLAPLAIGSISKIRLFNTGEVSSDGAPLLGIRVWDLKGDGARYAEIEVDDNFFESIVFDDGRVEFSVAGFDIMLAP